MFKVNENDINKIIHDILKIVGRMKSIGIGLSNTDKNNLQRLEKALLSIRQEIIKAVKNNNGKELELIKELISKIRKRNKDKVIALWLETLVKLFETIKWRIDS